MTAWTSTLTVTGPAVHGDLTVTGLATEHTALRVSARFADALRDEFPGATVTVDLGQEMTP